MLRKESPYRPEDRHLPTKQEPTKSPDALDVDLSLFIVPDRMSFNSGALKYCPQIVIQNKTVPYMFADPQPGDMTSWKVRAGRELKVTLCTTTHLSNATDGCVSSERLKAAYPGQYRAKCSADMPPTHAFSFDTELYANNKWLYDGKSWSGYGRPDDGKYPAEYQLQVSHVYHFSHALLDDDTENLMAEGMPASKDATQTAPDALDDVIQVEVLGPGARLRHRDHAQRGRKPYGKGAGKLRLRGGALWKNFVGPCCQRKKDLMHL